jgi:hypothetical protein
MIQIDFVTYELVNAARLHAHRCNLASTSEHHTRDASISPLLISTLQHQMEVCLQCRFHIYHYHHENRV